MTRRVLGTPVFDAEDDERTRTLILSDLHVPMDGGRALDMLREVLADAATHEPESTRVFILGDLFDVFVGPKQLRVGGWREVCEALRACSDRGVSITVLHGNRDFMLGATFAEKAGVRVVPGGLMAQVGGAALLALHGDELCQNDLAYQRSKRWLRHPLTRWVLLHLPLSVGMSLGRKARAKSKKSVAAAVQEDLWPAPDAVSAALAEGRGRLVFGHVHRAARGQELPTGDYRVLPAFDEEGVHLEDRGEGLHYRGLQGQAVADPGPWPFAS